MKSQEEFTKYEMARVIGARALQIAMDAPLLLKIPESELEEMKYDALKIAEYEFREGILPISIHRPTPRKGKQKLEAEKKEKISDEELIQKAKEVEKEIVSSPSEYSLVEEEEAVEEASEAAEEK